MSESKPLDERIKNLTVGLLGMAEGETIKVNKTFLEHVRADMVELSKLRRAQPAACEIAEYAEDCKDCGFCAQPANEPLTLEELSEMSDTDWVWVMFPELAPEESGWHRAKRLYDTYSKSHYSKTWLAYHRQPERSENK